MRPSATADARRMSASTVCASRMSPTTATAEPPAASMSATAFSSRAGSMSFTTTVAPARANRRLHPPPIPAAPPVTTAT
jgi:hypothetical protein